MSSKLCIACTLMPQITLVPMWYEESSPWGQIFTTPCIICSLESHYSCLHQFQLWTMLILMMRTCTNQLLIMQWTLEKKQVGMNIYIHSTTLLYPLSKEQPDQIKCPILDQAPYTRPLPNTIPAMHVVLHLYTMAPFSSTSSSWLGFNIIHFSTSNWFIDASMLLSFPSNKDHARYNQLHNIRQEHNVQLLLWGTSLQMHIQGLQCIF